MKILTGVWIFCGALWACQASAYDLAYCYGLQDARSRAICVDRVWMLDRMTHELARWEYWQRVDDERRRAAHRRDCLTRQQQICVAQPEPHNCWQVRRHYCPAP